MERRVRLPPTDQPPDPIPHTRHRQWMDDGEFYARGVRQGRRCVRWVSFAFRVHIFMPVALRVLVFVLRICFI